MKTSREVEPRKKRDWPFIIAVILIALVVSACLEAFFLFGSLVTIRTKAQTAMNGIQAYGDCVKKGNRDKLVQTAQEVHDSSHEMQQEMQSPAWTIASFVPVVGSDVRSARTLVNVLVDVSDEVLVPLAQGTELMSFSNLMQDSAVNMQALGDITAVVQKIGPVMSASAEKVASLPPAHIEQMGTVLEKARDSIVVVSDALTRINPLLGDLSTLLGANGQERNYLFIASNIGEIHAAGGYVGSIGVLSIKDGRLSLGDFTDPKKILPVDSVSAGATAEEIQIFGERVDTHHGDHNMIPDFSRVGQLYWNIWNTAKGEQLDGVIGVDPLFLQRVLKLIGKVDTSYGVSVDGDNAASMILNECLFLGWEREKCDDFYTEVASLSFDRLLSQLGSLDTLSFMEMVAASATEGRCNAWVKDDAIEDHIKTAGFGWELPHDATAPMLGVFLSDLSASKAPYYLSLDTSLSEPRVNPDGTKTYTATSVIKHNMDRSLLYDDLPNYIVTGWSIIADTRSRVELLERVTLIAPEGGKISNVQSSYADSVVPVSEAGFSEYSFQGNNTWATDLRIDAGESCTITYTVTVSSKAVQPLQIRQSPLVPHEVRGD